jgi:hypothetical protein
MKISPLDLALRPLEPDPALDPAADPALEQAQDLDADGVSDETEGWLGTSTNTDETGVDGRTDAGYLARSDAVEREQRSDHALQTFSDSGDEHTDVQLRVLARGERTLAGSPLGVRLSQMSQG